MGAVVCRRRRRHQLFSYGACVSARIVVAFFRLVVRSADRRTRHRVHRRVLYRCVAVSAVSVKII